VLCEKEVLGDYVGSPVMIPSAHADGVTERQGTNNAATQHPGRCLQLTGAPAATYSHALVLSTRTDRHVVPLCGLAAPPAAPDIYAFPHRHRASLCLQSSPESGWGSSQTGVPQFKARESLRVGVVADYGLVEGVQPDFL
jgi:hypothetical protein